MYTPIN